MSAQFLSGPVAQRLGALALILVVACVVSARLSPHFLQFDTVSNVLEFSAVIGLLGLGETLVIPGGGGGVDLSVGAMLSLAGVVHGFLVRAGVDVWLAAAVTLAVGAGLGAFNAFLVTVLRMPPLVATLATLYGYGGLAVATTSGIPLSGIPAEFGIVAQSSVAGIPTQVLLFLLPAYVALEWVLLQTPFGRHVYAAGNDEHAARLAGIRVERVRAIGYVVSGLLAGLGALVMNSWLLTARPDSGQGMELMAITVAVLGGTDIFGGQGTMTGSMLATLVVVTLQIGFQLANINQIWQLGILGLLLLSTVMVNQLLVFRGRGA